MPSFLRPLHNKHGFSWVEAVILAAVVGILLLIFVPKIIRFAEEAQKTADEQAAQNLVDKLIKLEQDGKIIFADGTTEVFAGNLSTKTIIVNTIEPRNIEILQSKETLSSMLAPLVGEKIPLQTGDTIAVTKANGEFFFAVYYAGQP